MLWIGATLLTLWAVAGQAREPVAAAVIALPDSGAGAAGSAQATALLEDELRRTGRYTVVERRRVREVLDEIAFQQSGVTAPEGATELGRLLNAAQLLYLQAVRTPQGRELTVRVVDVATGQVLRAESQSLPARGEIRTAVRRLARQLAAAASTPGPEEMALIEGGTFLMGTDQGLPEEGPAHEVAVASFQLDRYEVSRFSFQEWLVAQGRQPRPELSHADHPATSVSWEDAAAYCAARGKRLPTEAEWELAARGSSGRTFPWGEAAPTSALARFDATGPLPVDALPTGATPEGVFHLAGNAAEWVEDWWDPAGYRGSAANSPGGPSTGEYRTVRGGSWDQPAGELRGTARAFHNPDRGAAHIGFRCARSSPLEP